MKPMLAPPRHSSTPTCTVHRCAFVPATDPDKARATAARASERRMNKSPNLQVKVKREAADMAWSLWHNGGSAAIHDTVIPGRASWRELWGAIAPLRIHTPGTRLSRRLVDDFLRTNSHLWLWILVRNCAP